MTALTRLLRPGIGSPLRSTSPWPTATCATCASCAAPPPRASPRSTGPRSTSGRSTRSTLGTGPIQGHIHEPLVVVEFFYCFILLDGPNHDLVDLDFIFYPFISFFLLFIFFSNFLLFLISYIFRFPTFFPLLFSDFLHFLISSFSNFLLF